MNTQTFKDEVRIESSSDNGAIFRKFCDKLKVGEPPSVGQSILIDQDCTKDWYVLHDRYVHVANNNDVSYAENIVPNLKYSSTEEREKHIFPIIRAVIDNSSNAGISIGSSKEEKESLGTTWINLYGDVYIHGKLRIEAIHGDFKKGDKTPADYGTGTSDVNEIWSNRIYSSDSSNNLIVNENYQIISKAQFTNPNTVALSSFTNPTTYHRVIYPNVNGSNNNYHIVESYYLNTDGALYGRFGGGSGYINKTVFDVFGSMSIRGKAQCPTTPTADADLVNKKYAEEHNSLWKDLKTKDFLYGSYFRMIVGPYYIAEGRIAQTNGTVIEEGTVYGLIPNASRTATTGWQKIIDDTAFPLTSSVADYKNYY